MIHIHKQPIPRSSYASTRRRWWGSQPQISPDKPSPARNSPITGHEMSGYWGYRSWPVFPTAWCASIRRPRNRCKPFSFPNQSCHFGAKKLPIILKHVNNISVKTNPFIYFTYFVEYNILPCSKNYVKYMNGLVFTLILFTCFKIIGNFLRMKRQLCYRVLWGWWDNPHPASTLREDQLQSHVVYQIFIKQIITHQS